MMSPSDTDARAEQPTPSMNSEGETHVQVAESPLEGSPFVLEHKLSVSEAITRGTTKGAPSWLSWVEWPFRIKNPKTGERIPEACGYAMDAVGRTPCSQVGSYIGTAIIRMATAEAKSNGTGYVRGLKPSSLLTLESAVVGVFVALFMPVLGAIVDHTHHRRLVGALSAFLVVSCVGMQISVSVERNNWFFIWIVDFFLHVGYLVHVTSIFAYLPDLSLDESITSHYSAMAGVRQFATQFIFVCLIVLTGRARGTTRDRSTRATVQTAKDTATMAFCWSSLVLGYAWTFLMHKRPPLSKVPEGQTLLNTGFLQVARTSRKIWSRYNALRWFMVSLLWSPEAGASVVQSITVTYLVLIVKMTGIDIAKATLCFMVGSITGSHCSKLFNALVNPLNSYRFSMSMLGVSIGIGSAVLNGPEDRWAVFLLATFWGLFFGWTYPTQRVLFCYLMPKGQETEIMGLYTFYGQILGWIPPLIVTLMNENGVDTKYSLYVILFFCVFAIVCTLPMGSYRSAVDLVQRESADKLASVVESAVRMNGDKSTSDGSIAKQTQDSIEEPEYVLGASNDTKV